MPYDAPTVRDLVARFPAFASVPVSTVETYLADAGAGADQSWLEADYAPAISALAAHNMAVLGIGSHGEVAGYAAAGVTRIRSGQFDASFSESTVSRAAAGGLNSTPYGRAYLAYRRRNRAGPRLIAGGPVAVPDEGGVPWGY